ncbi:hypothetical protein [Saccharopolyspora sp. ASAGF58]|uniref:hypothetical protein n=1 Tax=Saccharopolyspora sp. ASAGF58 TaxID=2719023 RepID=UPI00143FF14A|nr:hypothetical protein [Saccharopolyspora sp. ASAGF58]QIZ35018.1 hypothetical protein FDZ84_10130 [Saccharopolyspora sp. ASAGF58]
MAAGTPSTRSPCPANAGTSDTGTFAKRSFDVSDRATVGSCKPSVYIPNDSDRRNVGATAAHTTRVFNSFEQGGANVVGVEDIKQVANRGKWVDLGEYAIDQGKLSGKPHNCGKDWRSRRRGRPHRGLPEPRHLYGRLTEVRRPRPGNSTEGASHRSDQSKTVTPWETGWRVPTFTALTGNSA